MTSRFSSAAGILLLSLGSILALFNLVAAWAGLETSAWRLWPVSVAALGLLCLIPPMFAAHRRGLAALYLPGLPLLAVSALGVVGQGYPTAWARLWPLIVLSLVLAFLLLAQAMRSAWLILPAAVLGSLGGSLLLTTTTDAWWLWAGLWALMPLCAGLTLFGIGLQQRRGGLMLAGGFVLVASAGVGVSLLFLSSGHSDGAGITFGATLTIIGAIMFGSSLRLGHAAKRS